MISRLRIVLYFIFIGWIAWILNTLRSGQKAKSELIVKDYDLKKEEINDAIDSSSIDELIKRNNERK